MSDVYVDYMDSVEMIHHNCKADADCLIWRGASTQSGIPRLGKGSARRVVWEWVNGDIPKGKLVSVSCENSLCLNPKHLCLTTKGEVLKNTRSRIDVELRRSASITRFARARAGKITMEIARAIRSSQKPGIEWARELGVSDSLVSLVRQGKSWKEPAFIWQGLVKSQAKK